MKQSELDAWHMRRALELALHGQGYVEPNPMVGCVIVKGAEIIAEGWHRKFGQAHAEVEALSMAGMRAAGATMYVTLEPCCHYGKTPPCTKAILAAGIRRVVVAQRDPFPAVAGGGISELAAAGVETEVGLLAEESQRINAPYLKLLRTDRPWVIAKWAMTLDGKIAARDGSSQWISGEKSRALVHRLRGRVDAILVGRGTAMADDPLLTARPPGPRTATRIVFDTLATLPTESRLVASARETPLIVAVGLSAPESDRRRLADAGCEVLLCEGATHAERLRFLLDELGQRRMTNVLVEGGGTLLGGLFDAGEIDEVHAFIAPKLIGGQDSPSPLQGEGLAGMSNAWELDGPTVEQVGGDIYLHGRVKRPPSGVNY